MNFRIDYETPDPKVMLIFEFVDEDLSKKLRMVRRFDSLSVKVGAKVLRTSCDKF
jgi:hypothetical protein